MGDLVKDIGKLIADHIPQTILILIFVFSLFFEFSKIKLHPITSFLTWIGKRLTAGLHDAINELKKDTNTKIEALRNENNTKFEELEEKTNTLISATSANCEQMKKKLAEVEEKEDLMAAARIKNHVLTFSRRCRNGERHTLEDFHNLIAENADYEKLVKKYGWTNDVYKEDYAFFLNEYHRCMKENDFLGAKK